MANLASITLPNNVTYNFRDSDAVHLTGAETITGAKTFGNEVIIDRDDDYPNIKFHFDGSYVGRIECEDTGIFNLVEGSETYSLPAPTGSSSYDILTSKNPVTIAQGGTSAIDCEGAVNNLFNGLAYYKYIPAEDPVEDTDEYYVGLGGQYDTTTPAPINITYSVNGVGFGCFPGLQASVELDSSWKLKLGTGIVTPVTYNILTDALTVGPEQTKSFVGGGARYTGTFGSYQKAAFSYGTFIVNRRSSTYITVIAFAYTAERGCICNTTTDGGTTWVGWKPINADLSVEKTSTISFSAGTVGTRGFAAQWSSTDIGGNPTRIEISYCSSSTNMLPICWIEGSTAYLRVYRATASAVSNASIKVLIHYT